MPGPVISDKRLDIQGLRALAVALVVIFHLWPRALPGGFIGVDIFFVISGYLITAHLLREVDRTGTVSITRFWARRIRRLLPASFLVLAVCVVLAFTVMPRSVLTQNLQEIAASAGYFVNWLLAFNAVDYLASENADSLVQHYWSLSVEEQFYIVWPLLVVAAAFLATKLLKTDRRLVVAIALSLVFVASLIASIVITATEPAFAYFITPTRAWEFAAGGLIAMLPALTTPSIWSRFAKRAGSWLALAVVALSALVIIDTTTPFPGWIALAPVLATGFLLWAGDDDHPWSPQFVSHAGPVQLLGDTSYAIYLWHWPLIIAAPYVLGHGIGLGTGIAIIAVTIALSIATKYLVEDPVRRARGPLSKRWPAYAFMATGMIILISTAPITGTVLQAHADRVRNQADAAVDDDTGCFGAYAILNGCADPYFVTAAVDPEFSARDFVREEAIEAIGECELEEFGGRNPKLCRVSGKGPSVQLVGDSHAQQFMQVFAEMAIDHDWTLTTSALTSCTSFEDERFVSRESSPDRIARAEGCVAWSDATHARLLREHPDLVVFGGRRVNAIDPAVARERLTSLIDAGISVVVIEDVPALPGDTTGPICVEAATTLDDPCAFPAPSFDYPLINAARAVGADVVELTDITCPAGECHTVIGGVLVYSDDDHLSTTFSRTLRPRLEGAILRALDGAQEELTEGPLR